MTTPRWLLTSQGYVPRSDRDAFIDRSIRSLLHVLSRVRPEPAAAERGSVLDARVKLVSLFTLVLLVSLSRGALFVMFAAALLLVLLAFRRAEMIRDVLKVSLAAAGFALLILLPSVPWGNAAGALRITLKVFTCVTAARLLSATTQWRAMTRAMADFRVPDLFVLVLDITVLYVWLLGRLSLEMMYALKLRSIGRNGGKAASLSGVGGTLFLKSRAMAEDLYAAMECRCFTGAYHLGRSRRIRPLDAGVLAADALLVVVFVVLGA